MNNTRVADVSLWKPHRGIDHALFGSHSYMVSRSGAKRLLDLSQTLEIHADHFLLICASLGLANGYIAASSTGGLLLAMQPPPQSGVSVPKQR